MSKLIFTDYGWDDYLYWQSQDKRTLKNKQSTQRYTKNSVFWRRETRATKKH